MKLKLNKKKIKSLSRDSHALPAELTQEVGGGARDAKVLTYGDHLLCDPGTRGCAFSVPEYRCI